MNHRIAYTLFLVGLFVIVASGLDTHEKEEKTPSDPVFSENCVKLDQLSRHSSSTPEADNAPAYAPAYEIITGALFWGSFCAAHDTTFIEDHRIAEIIRMDELLPLMLNEEEDLNLNIPLRTTRIVHVLVDVSNYIRYHVSQGKIILVHGDLDFNRSGAVVMAYLLRHEGMSFNEALHLLRTKTPFRAPSGPFLRVLQQIPMPNTLHVDVNSK